MRERGRKNVETWILWPMYYALYYTAPLPQTDVLSHMAGTTFLSAVKMELSFL